MNEEKLKKDTDCIYFLASPLTCKKGNDCEFRHSDIARLNPRDCRFWPAGKCIKSNCAFRHPPLDGFSTAAATAKKQRVPCYYFDQGYCAKGEKCIFTHGLASAAVEPAALRIETEKSPKLYSQPNDSTECSEKSSKRVCSLSSKLSLELEQAQATQLGCAVPRSEELQAGKVTDAMALSADACHSAEEQEGHVTDASSRMPATPDSAAPARGGSHGSVSGSNKSLQVTVIDDSPQEYPAADTSMKLPSEEVNKEFSVKDECCEVRPGGKRLQRIECCEARPGGKRLQRVDSPENRIYNCTESEELIEETSFDVLVGDARTDQLAFVADTDSLPSCDEPMDPVRGFTKYEYSHYYVYDSPGEFKVQHMYVPSEHHPYNDNMSSYDRVGGQISCESRDRLPLYDQKMIRENGKYQTLSNKDLRYHIIQRRRHEGNLEVKEDYDGRHHGGFMRNGLQDHRRHHDTHLRYQEDFTRARNASAEQVYGWRECPRRMHNSGYCRPEFKRGWDGAPDFERANRERVFSKKLRHETEYCSQPKGKEGRCLDGGAFDPVLHEFVSTRGLAALELEKLTHLRQQGVANQMTYHQAQHLTFQVENCISPATVIGTTCKGTISLQRPESASTTLDFEGPKPLSVLLEEKRRRLASAEAERAKASRIESERGTCKNFGSSKTPDFEAPETVSVHLKGKHRGVANGEAKGVKALELETKVDIVSLNIGNPESSVETNLGTTTACLKKDDHVQNSTSNLPAVHLHAASTGGLTSDGKAPCLVKIKETKIYPVDTDLSLSLSYPREGHKSFIDDCTSDAKADDSASAG